jgi:hypothetical protein
MNKKIISLILFLIVLSPVKIQANSMQNSVSRATVVPAKFEIFGIPGESVTQTLKVTNDDNQAALLAVSVENFHMTGEDGEIVLGGQAHKNAETIAKWITFTKVAEQFNPKETKLLDFKIDIPKGTPPGGQYAAIVLSMDRIIKHKGDISGSARVVSLVMLTVIGDIRDRATLENFSFKKADNGFVFNSNIRNLGNNHIRPRGQIIISDMLGNKIEEVPFGDESILPGVTRKISTDWEQKKYLPGFYKATLVGQYGYRKDLPLSGAIGFWLSPFYFFVFLGILLGFIGYLIFQIRKHNVIKKIISYFRHKK